MASISRGLPSPATPFSASCNAVFRVLQRRRLLLVVVLALPLVALPLEAALVAVALQGVLTDPHQDLHRLHHRRVVHGRGHPGRVQRVRVLQEVAPPLFVRPHLVLAEGELGQLDDVDAEMVRGNLPRLPVYHLEAVVVDVLLGVKHSAPEEADRVGRSEVAEVLPRGELARIELRPVVQQPGDEGRVQEHLHFDIEPPAPVVAGLDVQDRELVVGDRLLVERVEQFRRTRRGIPGSLAAATATARGPSRRRRPS